MPKIFIWNSYSTAAAKLGVILPHKQSFPYSSSLRFPKNICTRRFGAEDFSIEFQLNVSGISTLTHWNSKNIGFPGFFLEIQ